MLARSTHGFASRDYGEDLSAALSTGHCHCFVAKRAVITRLNPLVITMAYSVREAFSAVKIVCSGHVSGKYSCDQFNGGCKKL